MKVKSYEGSETRKILSAMVTNPTVLARVSSQWKKEGLFNSKWADLVGGWCVKHFNKYGEPPNGQLKVIFDKWADSTKSDEATVRVVSNFLEETSDEFDRAKVVESTEFLLDRAGELFNKQRMQKAIEEAELELGQGKGDRARELLTAGAEKIELGGNSELVSLADVDRRELTWLWQGWVPPRRTNNSGRRHGFRKNSNCG